MLTTNKTKPILDIVSSFVCLIVCSLSHSPPPFLFLLFSQLYPTKKYLENIIKTTQMETSMARNNSTLVGNTNLGASPKKWHPFPRNDAGFFDDDDSVFEISARTTTMKPSTTTTMTPSSSKVVKSFTFMVSGSYHVVCYMVESLNGVHFASSLIF